MSYKCADLESQGLWLFIILRDHMLYSYTYLPLSLPIFVEEIVQEPFLREQMLELLVLEHSSYLFYAWLISVHISQAFTGLLDREVNFTMRKRNSRSLRLRLLHVPFNLELFALGKLL